MELQILAIVGKVLGVPAESITHDMTPEDFSNWNSLNHMNLILELEEGFSIQFTNEEIAELVSVKSILEVVSGKLQP